MRFDAIERQFLFGKALLLKRVYFLFELPKVLLVLAKTLTRELELRLGNGYFHLYITSL
jgi:hypothetical protein